MAARGHGYRRPFLGRPKELGWDPTKVAIKTFVDDMTSAGLDVALEVFPPLFGEVGECTGAGYDAPTVAMGALPGIGTPIEGALRGATGFCVAYAVAHPDEECVAVPPRSYDDPEAPTRVIACEQSCELLQSTPQAKIDILLGCKTIPLM